MMFGLGDEPRAAPVGTFVLRVWRASGEGEPRAFRYQTIHVQTGDIAYFGNMDNLLRYMQRQTDLLAGEPPTPLFQHPRNGAHEG